MMPIRFHPMLVVAAFVLFLSVLPAADARQAPPAQAADVLNALLTEVRGLRIAMEQMASAGPRVQLALGRLQLQEQRVNTLLRRVESIRAALSEAERNRDMLQQRSQDLESAARAESTTDDRRRQYEHELAEHKRELARISAEFNRLTAEETGVAAEIATEQGRWAEINQRLEDLERALARR
jgi:predicted  nucleic acid-binding Zn-ribbon protein